MLPPPAPPYATSLRDARCYATDAITHGYADAYSACAEAMLRLTYGLRRYAFVAPIFYAAAPIFHYVTLTHATATLPRERQSCCHYFVSCCRLRSVIRYTILFAATCHASHAVPSCHTIRAITPYYVIRLFDVPLRHALRGAPCYAMIFCAMMSACAMKRGVVKGFAYAVQSAKKSHCRHADSSYFAPCLFAPPCAAAAASLIRAAA